MGQTNEDQLPLEDSSKAADISAKQTENEKDTVNGGESAKKPLQQEELDLIQNRINQLSSSTKEEDQEAQYIATIEKHTRKTLKEITDLFAKQDVSDTDKVKFIIEKYAAAVEEKKRQEIEIMKLKKKQEVLLKDKDAYYLCRIDLAKANTMRMKLENLCRDLHKENKNIKEEARKLALSEQQKREELSAKFESTILEITNRLEEDTDKKLKRVEDNLLREKFESFLEQYNLREKHFNSVLKAKDLELQLSQAKLTQQTQINEQQSSKYESIKEQFNSLSRSESDLKKQLATYVEKFKQVEDTMMKSNELFNTFKQEMQQMTKKNAKLDKEHRQLMQKCESMTSNILKLVEDNGKYEKGNEVLKNQKQKLEQLCRTLQSERNNALALLAKYTDEKPDLGANQ